MVDRKVSHIIVIKISSSSIQYCQTIKRIDELKQNSGLLVSEKRVLSYSLAIYKKDPSLYSIQTPEAIYVRHQTSEDISTRPQEENYCMRYVDP